MDPMARITFGSSLLDLTQPISMKISKTGGKFHLNVVIGIQAVDVQEGDNPGADVRLNNRDAVLGQELYSGGRGNISLSKIGDADGASSFVLVLNGSAGTKIPGTGFEVRRLDLDTVTLP